jgi:hypothetical protein
MGELMALKEIRPGLRPVWYNGVSAAKVFLVVQPGDELLVTDDVAGQLFRASAQFKAGPAPAAPPVPAPAPVHEDDAEADLAPRPRRTRKD